MRNGRCRTGREVAKLGAVAVDEAADVPRIASVELGDFHFELVEVAADADVRAALEGEPIAGIDPLQRHVVPQRQPAAFEHAFQDLRVEEERRAEVEAEALGRDGPRATADRVGLLEKGDVEPFARQQHRRSETSGTGPDDRDALFALAVPQL